MVFGKKKDPLKEAQEREAKLRDELAATERARKELEERSAPTPVIETAQVGGEAPAAPAAAPVHAAQPERPKTDADKRLEELLRYFAENYDGGFGELGPSGHASVERGLLLGILGELRLLRQELKKR